MPCYFRFKILICILLSFTGILRKFFSLQLFKRLNKLTFQVYLIHLIIIWYLFLTSKSTLAYDNFDLVCCMMTQSQVSSYLTWNHLFKRKINFFIKTKHEISNKVFKFFTTYILMLQKITIFVCKTIFWSR